VNRRVVKKGKARSKFLGVSNIKPHKISSYLHQPDPYFKFLDPSGAEIGTVTKKWAGICKGMFTTADTYMISIDETKSDHKTDIMLRAAGLAIDIVFKERR